MADIRYPRERPNVRIYLHSADIRDMMTQEGVLHHLSTEQLNQIATAIAIEMNYRQRHGEIIEGCHACGRTAENWATCPKDDCIKRGQQ